MSDTAALPELTTEDLYGPLTVVRDRLDQRTTEYVFDLEADMPWDRLDEPGLYIPTPLFELFGIDMQAVASNREAYEVLHWSTALSICRTFQLLERGVIKFCGGEADRLGPTTSIDRLCEEENKHVQLFRRLASHLTDQRPDLMEDFNASFRDTFLFLREVYQLEHIDQLHLKLWMTSLFFEPATLHLADELEETNEPMQPAWLAANRLHAQEEQQHIATVAAYASQLKIDDDGRAAVVDDFVEQFSAGFQQLHGSATPLALLQKRWPELNVAPPPDAIPAPFAEEISYSSHFKPLRRIVPDLEDRIRTAPGVKSPLPSASVAVIVGDGAQSLVELLGTHSKLTASPEIDLTLDDADQPIRVGRADHADLAAIEATFGERARYIEIDGDGDSPGPLSAIDPTRRTTASSDTIATGSQLDLPRLATFLGLSYESL